MLLLEANLMIPIEMPKPLFFSLTSTARFRKGAFVPGVPVRPAATWFKVVHPNMIWVGLQNPYVY